MNTRTLQHQDIAWDDPDRGLYYREGFLAHTEGKPITANPYNKETKPNMFGSWVGGWEEAHEDNEIFK